MGDFWRDSARAMAETARWIRERDREARQGRDAAMRAGARLVRQTTAELRAGGEEQAARFGVRIPETRPRRPPAPVRQGVPLPSARPVRRQPQPNSPSYAAATGVREIMRQQEAFDRAAADFIAPGLRDHIDAGLDALLDGGDVRSWGHRFGAGLADEQAHTRYDRENRRIAHGLGTAAGAAASFTVPAGAALRTGRLSGAALPSAQELRAWMGANAAAGVGAQIVSDAAGGRFSTPQDAAAAAIGGAASALPERISPAAAGAIDGFVTSVVQDELNGRPIQWEAAARAAVLGRALGGATGALGRNVSNGLPMGQKGQLGEVMGRFRSAVNGTPIQPGGKTRDYYSGRRYWYPDGRSGDLRFEYKLGYGARLSGPQERARAALGSNFVAYHFTPDDVGRAVAVPAIAAARPLVGIWEDSRGPAPINPAGDRLEQGEYLWPGYYGTVIPRPTDRR